MGYITYVMVGDHRSIEIPYLDRLRTSSSRLRGLRLIHTHLYGEPLDEEDLADLILLRLDYITAVVPDENSIPKMYYSAHINPDPNGESPWILADRKFAGQLQTDFLSEIQDLENEISRNMDGLIEAAKQNRAFLVGVYKKNQTKYQISSSLDELKELCRTADIHVVDSFRQIKDSLDPATVLGKGKIREILLKAVQKSVELLVFDLELSPSQAKKISQSCDLKVIDRTQLILDIFARNAQSRDGKLQVELAQLKYLKGRLTELDDNMSRLTGGIGGRGPGETKLEIGKRRVEERISRLEKELESLKKRRELNRKQRKRKDVPVAAIIGYTNAGKSTLLNSLTNSNVTAEDKLFATLDPTTRRVRFPEEREIIISDTVGFIRNLPPELTNAFKATLEELGDADILLHVVDISNPNYEAQIESVENILESLDLKEVRTIRVYNKADAVDPERMIPDDGIAVSAVMKTGFENLLREIEYGVWSL